MEPWQNQTPSTKGTLKMLDRGEENITQESFVLPITFYRQHEHGHLVFLFITSKFTCALQRNIISSLDESCCTTVRYEFGSQRDTKGTT